MKQKYEQQMKKGVLEMLVLQLLSEEEKYGYQLICELKERSSEMFLLKEGTLYPVLYRMEDDGLVVSRWSQPRGKEVSKKYYCLAEEGRDTLEELKSLWKTFSRTVDTVLGQKPERGNDREDMAAEYVVTAGKPEHGDEKSGNLSGQNPSAVPGARADNWRLPDKAECYKSN